MRKYISAIFNLAVQEPEVTRFAEDGDRPAHDEIQLRGASRDIDGVVQVGLTRAAWDAVAAQCNPLSAIQIVGSISDEPSSRSARGTAYYRISPETIGVATAGPAGGLRTSDKLTVRHVEPKAKAEGGAGETINLLGNAPAEGATPADQAAAGQTGQTGQA